MRIKENVQLFKSQIPAHITIIGVTKYVDIETAQVLADNGITHIGENRSDGFLTKQAALGKDEITWHFIGSLQTRKVKDVINQIDYLHSLDRLSLAKEINKRASQPIKCFIQVSTSGEESKHGMEPGAVENFLQELQDLPNVQPIGLMTMAPFTEDEAVLRQCFNTLKALRDRLQASHPSITELSMGMSNDYKITIEEGATFIRVGSALTEGV